MGLICLLSKVHVPTKLLAVTVSFVADDVHHFVGYVCPGVADYFYIQLLFMNQRWRLVKRYIVNRV